MNVTWSTKSSLVAGCFVERLVARLSLFHYQKGLTNELLWSMKIKALTNDTVHGQSAAKSLMCRSNVNAFIFSAYGKDHIPILVKRQILSNGICLFMVLNILQVVRSIYPCTIVRKRWNHGSQVCILLCFMPCSFFLWFKIWEGNAHFCVVIYGRWMDSFIIFKTFFP